MADSAFGDFFLSDTDDELLDDDELLSPPVVVPGAPTPSATPAVLTPARAVTAPHAPSREERLAASLDALMDNNQEILASALVSLDGFTMASALPETMHDDRVGAMSAAILGLGERAAIELGRGPLTQVFVEGEDGYVILVAVGKRAVLTCIAASEAKLGLVLYDMRGAAEAIAEVLG